MKRFSMPIAAALVVAGCSSELDELEAVRARFGEGAAAPASSRCRR